MLPTGYGTEGIAKQVKAISDARAEAAARKFVPGVQKVYGIRMPMLNAIVAEVKKNATPSFILSLWKSGAFEEKILAAKLVGRISKKQPGHALQMVERFFCRNTRMGRLRYPGHAKPEADCPKPPGRNIRACHPPEPG